MEHGMLIGWGYEGQTIDSLLGALRSWQIDELVDVRLNPISRKPGFSKTRLREACESVGVDYLHLRGLGNPKGNRAGFAAPRTDDGGARDRFRSEVLSSDSAVSSLRDLARKRDEGRRILILCFEQDESCCHRHEVLSAVRELDPLLRG